MDRLVFSIRSATKTEGRPAVTSPMTTSNKTVDELIREEDAIDPDRVVVPPLEVQRILKNKLASVSELPPEHEYEPSVFADTASASDVLWEMYYNPDNQALLYLAHGEQLPDPLKEYRNAGYVNLVWNDHYYKRLGRFHGWYLLPSEYWDKGDIPDETWPAAIRKIVRNSQRYWKIELTLTEKAVRNAERKLQEAQLARATRPEVFEAKPGAFGFSVNLKALLLQKPRLRKFLEQLKTTFSHNGGS